MTKRDAEAAVHKYGSGNEAARRLGVARSTVQKALRKGDESKQMEAKTDRPSGRVATVSRRISERDLLMATDSETRFHANLTTLLKSLKRGEYIRDIDARKEVGAMGDASLWREVRKGECFRPFVLEIGSGSEPAIYWGHPESVEKMCQNGKAHRSAWAR